MSIALTGTTSLDNASIQYTYPEMDIRGIDKATGIIKFKFRNGLSSSSFSFTDVDASIFKSGIASEGIISKKKHTYIENDSNITYELTIKHITSTANNFFYVVFPIKSGGKTSFINSISDSTDYDINVINMNDADNKSLNSMIGDEYSSTFYKYINNFDDLVFVFNKPITMSMIDDTIPKVSITHSLWISAKTPIYLTNSDDIAGGKVSEEIVCDYSGDTVQTINNEPLNRGAAKIGWTTLVFILLAVWIGYFYSIPFIKDNIIDTITTYGRIMIVLNALLIIIVFASVYGSDSKLSMFTTPTAILLFITLLWPIEFVFRICAYFVLYMFNSISKFDTVFDGFNPIPFVKGYLNSDTKTANENSFAKYALYILFSVWLIAIFAIVSK